MNVYLDMVGCRLNQAEIETYARQLRAAGHNLVSSAARADLVVVNTCSVTGASCIRFAPKDTPGKSSRCRGGGHRVLVKPGS